MVQFFPTDNETELISAITRKDQTRVTQLIESGCDINGDGCGFGSPLNCAMQQCYGTDVEGSCVNEMKQISFNILQQLILKDANLVNHRDYSLRTPLHDAVSKFGSLGVVQILLEAGANVHAVDIFSETPLHECMIFASFNDLKFPGKYPGYDIVKLLMDRGADVDAKDDRGRTPRFWAKKCNQEMQDIMLDIADPSNEGCTAPPGGPRFHDSTIVNSLSDEIMKAILM